MNLRKTMVAGLTSILMLSAGCGSESSDDSAPTSSAANTAIEAIMTRKSVRRFENKAVSTDTLEIILRAGMAAPTALNTQPWKIVVVKNPQLLKEISDSMPNTRTATAPLALVVCGDKTKMFEGEGREFWVQDCSAMTENILLAAHSLGLGAVWTGIYPNSEPVAKLSKILDLDTRLLPLCVVPVGYPAEDPEPKDKWNPDNVIYK